VNIKVTKDNIFKLTIGNESFHEISNDNRTKSVKISTFKILSEVQFFNIMIYINTFGLLTGSYIFRLTNYLIYERRHLCSLFVYYVSKIPTIIFKPLL